MNKNQSISSKAAQPKSNSLEKSFNRKGDMGGEPPQIPQGDAFLAYLEQKISSKERSVGVDEKTKKKSPMEEALNQQYLTITQNPTKYPIESKWIAPGSIKSSMGYFVGFCVIVRYC